MPRDHILPLDYSLPGPAMSAQTRLAAIVCAPLAPVAVAFCAALTAGFAAGAGLSPIAAVLGASLTWAGLYAGLLVLPMIVGTARALMLPGERRRATTLAALAAVAAIPLGGGPLLGLGLLA